MDMRKILNILHEGFEEKFEDKADECCDDETVEESEDVAAEGSDEEEAADEVLEADAEELEGDEEELEEAPGDYTGPKIRQKRPNVAEPLDGEVIDPKKFHIPTYGRYSDEPDQAPSRRVPSQVQRIEQDFRNAEQDFRAKHKGAFDRWEQDKAAVMARNGRVRDPFYDQGKAMFGGGEDDGFTSARAAPKKPLPKRLGRPGGDF